MGDSLGKNGYMYMYGWVLSLFTWNITILLTSYIPQYKIVFNLKTRVRRPRYCYHSDLTFSKYRKQNSKSCLFALVIRNTWIYPLTLYVFWKNKCWKWCTGFSKQNKTKKKQNNNPVIPCPHPQNTVIIAFLATQSSSETIVGKQWD